MKIDLNTLKPGDTVHHRNGGVSVISSTGMQTHDTIAVYLEGPENCNEPLTFFVYGQYCFEEGHPLDIIEIITAPQAKTPLDEWIEEKNSFVGGWADKVNSLAYAIRDTLKLMDKK